MKLSSAVLVTACLAVAAGQQQTGLFGSLVGMGLTGVGKLLGAPVYYDPTKAAGGSASLSAGGSVSAGLQGGFALPSGSLSAGLQGSLSTGGAPLNAFLDANGNIVAVEGTQDGVQTRILGSILPSGIISMLNVTGLIPPKRPLPQIPVGPILVPSYAALNLTGSNDLADDLASLNIGSSGSADASGAVRMGQFVSPFEFNLGSSSWGGAGSQGGVSVKAGGSGGVEVPLVTGPTGSSFLGHFLNMGGDAMKWKVKTEANLANTGLGVANSSIHLGAGLIKDGVGMRTEIQKAVLGGSTKLVNTALQGSTSVAKQTLGLLGQVPLMGIFVRPITPVASQVMDKASEAGSLILGAYQNTGNAILDANKNIADAGLGFVQDATGTIISTAQNTIKDKAEGFNRFVDGAVGLVTRTTPTPQKV